MNFGTRDIDLLKPKVFHRITAALNKRFTARGRVIHRRHQPASQTIQAPPVLAEDGGVGGGGAAGDRGTGAGGRAGALAGTTPGAPSARAGSLTGFAGGVLALMGWGERRTVGFRELETLAATLASLRASFAARFACLKTFRASLYLALATLACLRADSACFSASTARRTSSRVAAAGVPLCFLDFVAFIIAAGWPSEAGTICGRHLAAPE